jgi:hypothetical protein
MKSYILVLLGLSLMVALEAASIAGEVDEVEITNQLDAAITDDSNEAPKDLDEGCKNISCCF